MYNKLSQNYESIINLNLLKSDKLNQQLNSFLRLNLVKIIESKTKIKYPDLDLFLKGRIDEFEIHFYADLTNKTIKNLAVLVHISDLKIYFQSLDDIFAVFLHTALHAYIQKFWKKSLVNKSQFLLNEIDYLEDVYIQSIVFQISNDVFLNYPNLFKRMNEKYTFCSQSQFNDRINVLNDNDHNCSLEPLNVIRNWLYSVDDRLNFDTFEKYIFLITKFRHLDEYKNFISTICLFHQNFEKKQLLMEQEI